MSSGSYKQVYVQCPFYKYDDGSRRIVCEGIIGEDSSTGVIFKRKSDYAVQISVFCCKNYQKCEVYRMLSRNYEDG